MKILYLGTVCDITEYEKKLKDCCDRPSIAPIVFESALLSGFKQNGVEVDVYSFPMIPTWPKAKWLIGGNKQENLSCGYKCIWLRTVNFPIIKQFIRKWDGYRLMRKWLKKHQGEECMVLSYSIPPFLAKDIISLCRKYNVKCVAIVTDLLRDMYVNEQNSLLVTKLKEYYLRNAIALQGQFDGYVYLTEEMKEIVNPEKPYIVMEGIAEISDVAIIHEIEKAIPPAIMYAGMVEEKYGILNLVDAFEQASLGETELWIFGNGNIEEEIQYRCDKNPRIRFWGRKSRAEILLYEKKASLLVNPRNVKDVFTQYSFPSKTIEYMLSGTPVLTTRLKGIPEEYYEYLFSCSDNEVDTMSKAIQTVFSMPIEQRTLLGDRAKNYIIQHKNADKQTKRMLDFLRSYYEN